MTHHTRAARQAVHVPLDMFDDFEEAAGAWHETEAEIRAAIAWGQEKRLLLAWVRAQMAVRLTRAEAESIRLHYLEGLSQRAAAERIGRHPSTVGRAAARGVQKLRAVAAGDPIRVLWEYHARRSRRVDRHPTLE